MTRKKISEALGRDSVLDAMRGAEELPSVEVSDVAGETSLPGARQIVTVTVASAASEKPSVVTAMGSRVVDVVERLGLRLLRDTPCGRRTVRAHAYTFALPRAGKE